MLYRSRSEPIAGGAEQSILRDILLEAAAIIAAIPKEHEPDNMRAPIADELEGLAGMLSDGVQPSDMQDILAEAASIIARSEEHTSELQSLMRSSYAVFCLK